MKPPGYIGRITVDDGTGFDVFLCPVCRILLWDDAACPICLLREEVRTLERRRIGHEPPALRL
jgi:hypothetical protein